MSLSPQTASLRQSLSWLSRLLSRPSPTPHRPHCRLQLEPLETRETPATMAVGMNLEHAVDYNPMWMFTDVFQTSRDWVSLSYNTATRVQTWGDGGPVHVDAHGWPTELTQWTNAQGQLVQQRLDTLMCDGIDGHYPAGTYTAEWQGDATVEWGGDARIRQTGQTADGQHFALLDVTPTRAGINMQIDSLNPANPIHDVHVWMPDYYGQHFAGQVWRPGADFSPFHPLFLQRLAPFHTIRFMQTEAAITSDIVHWDDRRKLDDARQSTFATSFQNGIAPEYQIALSNELHANPWFSMPYLADDDYIRHFAQLVHDTLSPGLTVYVEWSDEVWNPTAGYEAHTWVQQQMSLPQNAGLSFYQIWAREMRRDFDVWSQVFADRPGQLVRVVAGQAANSWVAAQVLQNMGGAFDAVACDAYITFARPQLAQFNASTTPDQVIDAMWRDALPNTLQFLQNHKALADQYSAQLGRHIQLLTYEGGPLPNGYGQSFDAAFRAAARGPRMYELTEALLAGAQKIGVDLYTHYVYTDTSPFGDASTLRWQDQPPADAPKYRALIDFMNGADRPPVLAAVANQTARAGSTLTLTLHATDPDGAPLRFLLAGVPPAGAALDPASGVFTWTPSAGVAGDFTLTFFVFDGRGGADARSVRVRVLPAGTSGDVTASVSLQVEGVRRDPRTGLLYEMLTVTNTSSGPICGPISLVITKPGVRLVDPTGLIHTHTTAVGLVIDLLSGDWGAGMGLSVLLELDGGTPVGSSDVRVQSGG